LAWLTGARLLFMSIALALVGSLYLGGQYEARYYTLRAGLFTFGGGFVMTALYAVLLRRGRHVELLADAQLVLDQVTWTAVVYLTGGAASGATSFYGLSCLVGAALTGLRGASVAAVSGGICYGAVVTALAKHWILPPPDQPPAMYLPSSEELSFYVTVNLLVLVVVMLILMLLLRALISPIILTLTVILSYGTALGLSTILFHTVFTHLFEVGSGFEHADASFPLFVFVFLVALGIDYNIFLMTRVREETQTRGTREGSLVALAATGGVITSAGLVLAATFAVLGSLPLVFLAQLGTAVALGVILDTMIVRSVLVTAINLDLGNKIWWPSKLDRPGPTQSPAQPQEEEVLR
jgi:hypothetical protein